MRHDTGSARCGAYSNDAPVAEACPPCGLGQSRQRHLDEALEGRGVCKRASWNIVRLVADQEADSRRGDKETLNRLPFDPVPSVLILPVHPVGFRLECQRDWSLSLRQPMRADAWGEPTADQPP